MKLYFWFVCLLVCSSTIASDLSIGSSITSPVSGCNLTSTEIVKVTVSNATTTAYSGTYTVTYQLNNNPIITETQFVPVLPVGGTWIYEFNTLLDLSSCGIQSLTISVSDINDSNTSNDTIVVSITNDCSPSPGSFSGPSSVCETGNSGQVTLNGNTGVINSWAFSNDNGNTLTPIPNTTSNQSFTDITVDRLYRVFYSSQNGICPTDSIDYTILVDVSSFAGILSSDSSHCDTILPTTLFLNGYNGVVNNYKLSLNGGSSYTTFTNPFDTLQYAQLSNSFQFFAITQNASCPPDSSNIVSISISDGPDAGEIIGDDTLCAGLNSANLNLINFDGTIIDWEYSSDNGNTWISTGLNSNNISLPSITTSSNVRVIVEKVPCGTDTSFFSIVVNQGSDAGNAIGSVIYCGGINNGSLSVSGFTGEILDWIYLPNGAMNYISSGNLNDTLLYNNISITTDYAVIVQFESCPPDTSNFISITINSESNAGQILAPDTLCYNSKSKELALANYVGSIIDWEYSTDNGVGWISSGVSDSILNHNCTAGETLFRVFVQNANCDPDTSLTSIFVLDSVASFAFVDTIDAGNSLQLNGGIGENFEWFPNIYIDDFTIVNPLVSPPVNTVYEVIVTDSNGCTNISMHSIIISNNTVPLTINNFITPNGDGYNDTWKIENIELFPNNSVVVFDSYGQIIFETDSYQNDWDVNSSGLPDGTYLYIIKTKPDSSPIKGAITIVNS